MTDKMNKVAIIGLGNVGTAMAVALQRAGYKIAAVAAASTATLERNGQFIAAPRYTQAEAAAHLGDVILITTQDDKIGKICARLAQGGHLGKGKRVIHMSGAGGLDLLQPAVESGAHIASIHPIQSFTNLEASLAALPGTLFGITCNAAIREWCFNFVEDLQGIPVEVADGDKPLYHAASCMASSYLSALLYLVEEVFKTVGMNAQEARRAFLPLVNGTLHNIQERGQVAALSGPIARGDLHTITRHIEALGERLPHLLPVYITMGLSALRLAAKKGTLAEAEQEGLGKVLLAAAAILPTFPTR